MRERDGQNALRPSLHADRSGMALVYVTLMLPVIVGFALLALDVSRAYILSSQLQKGADAIALAMAAELDHTNTVQTRAEAAMNNIVSNTALFTSSFNNVDGNSVTYRFLKSLPANDKDAIDPTLNVTTDQTLANYVEVTVKPARFDTVFPASFIGAVGSFSTSATAVAGLNGGACSIVPMFICNPLEPTNNTDVYRTTEITDHIADVAKRRRLFELKAFPSNDKNAQWSPGNFGYVNTPLGKGANALGDAISQAVPTACVSLSSLTTKPGNTTVANDAFNVRFDMYSGSYKPNDETILPARNVRKSFTIGSKTVCSPSEITDLYTNSAYTTSNPPAAMGFPRDKCLVSSTTTCKSTNGGSYGGRIGDGDWNGMFDLYMATNFGSTQSQQPQKDTKTGSYYTSPGFSPATTDLPTRYEIYRAEIDQGKIGTNSMATPACYSGKTAVSDLPDRRLMFVAIANCIASPPGSGSKPLTAVAIGKFFLTEPVGSSGNLYAELVDIVKPGVGSGTNGALIADNVQLYR